MSTIILVKKRILVVGYGGAGSQFTAKVAQDVNNAVTVITPFDYQEVPLSMTKAIAVGPKEHAKVIFPLLKEDNVEYVIDSCVGINGNTATTALGRNIDFDICVIATGQKIPTLYPDIKDSTAEARKATIAKVHNDIIQANHIVISGGGPVGTELAADIKLRNKEKRITVVSPDKAVLTAMSASLSKLATTHLQDIGLELILSDRVIDYNENTHMVSLASGQQIPCDVYIRCYATGGNATFLPAASQDKRGYVLVDDTFKVQGYQNVFAIGDCSNFDRVKSFPKIYDQLPTMFFNTHAVLHNTPLKHHIKGASMMGRFNGPGMVAFGHGLDDGYGVGPDLPGCLGTCCWCCCCFGWPCSPPAGHATNKAKSDLNAGAGPKKGLGLK